MPRRGRKKIRRTILQDHSNLCYKPCGVRGKNLEFVTLSKDEIEALRLSDYEALYQQECAQIMGISRTTFSRILESAHKKISDAFLHQKAINIYNKGDSMKIAIPVKMKKPNPPLSPLFGKAKWFAIVDGNHIEILQNSNSGGKDVIKWLLSLGVDTIIFQEMGMSPYNIIQNVGTINLYFAGEERILLNDALEKFKNNNLEKVTNLNAQTIIKQEARHSNKKSL